MIQQVFMEPGDPGCTLESDHCIRSKQQSAVRCKVGCFHFAMLGESVEFNGIPEFHQKWSWGTSDCCWPRKRFPLMVVLWEMRCFWFQDFFPTWFLLWFFCFSFLLSLLQLALVLARASNFQRRNSVENQTSRPWSDVHRQRATIIDTSKMLSDR